MLTSSRSHPGFTWRDSFAFYEHPERYGKSWSDVVEWQVSSYDLSGEWWVPTLDRRALGITVLEGFFDASIILVAQAQGKAEKSVVSKHFSWMEPLRTEVWFMILGSGLLVGAVYAVIEQGVPGTDLDRANLASNGAHSIFSSLLLFTGGGGPAPRSFPGQLLLLGAGAPTSI